MDFFEHQERARRKTGLLVIYFLAAVALIVAAVYAAIAGVLFYAGGGDPHSLGKLWFPEVFAATTGGTLLLILVGSLYKIIELSQGGEYVARSLGGRPILPDTRDLRERVLLNVVEEMAIAAGTPVPPVFLLDHETAINAFAAGTTPQNAVIGVTRGTIHVLSRDELQGVIAHEFSHILNGDMRLNIRLMGILNGILLIAMIGYVLMRSSSRASYSSSDSSEKRGGNPLPLVGLLLYIIGYVGVFFGQLIKSAVSRQREFLADASAVQFTRLPDGIAGALKKIGGYVRGSRLEATQAEEASHMFFGNGVRAPLLNLLATHPPLAERIRRIDPRFDGQFPQAAEVDYSAADVIDPQTLAVARAAPAGASAPGTQRAAAAADVHAAAEAGAQSFAQRPTAAVEQVGAPREEHLQYAATLMASLPAAIAVALRDPLGAVAVVYALLLDEEDGEIRAKQLEYLATKADRRAAEETRRLIPAAGELAPETKLPVVSLVVPALKGLSPRQLTAFRDDVVFLIEVDQRVTLFEYAVHRLVLKRLLPRLERPRPPRIEFDKFAAVAGNVQDLLSVLAYCGARDDEQAARAFGLGTAQLPEGGKSLSLAARRNDPLVAVDAALDRLARAAPPLVKSLLEACAACICADGRVTVEEGELLRVIADALASPMPPLLALPEESP